MDQAAPLARLPERPSVTRNLNIHGYHPQSEQFGQFAVYGADAPCLQDLIRQDPALGEPLNPALPVCPAEVLWAVRHEMARTVEDVLARRTRALFLNAKAAVLMAPQVAQLMARQLNADPHWAEEQVRLFEATARGFLVAAH